MEGWGWQSVHDPAELPGVMERWQQSIASGQPFEMLFPIRGSDGVFRRFLTRIVPVTNDAGEVVRWLGTNVEVESQLNAEAALEVSEAKLQVLTDAMPQMVWSTLPDGYHDYFNARWYEFTGVPYGSTDGEGWNGVFHAEDQERAWGLWQHSLERVSPMRLNIACDTIAVFTAGYWAARFPSAMFTGLSPAGSARAPILTKPSAMQRLPNLSAAN